MVFAKGLIMKKRIVGIKANHNILIAKKFGHVLKDYRFKNEEANMAQEEESLLVWGEVL